MERAEKIRARDQRKCAGCGRSDVPLHVHHIVPLSKGGSNTEDNLITLCSMCHNSIHREKEHYSEYAPMDSCYYCSNCDRYYSIEYARNNNEKCPICDSKLTTWMGENRV
ncbi:MAG: HNH endonuclease [Candidatus Ranarchaeia archaeon]